MRGAADVGIAFRVRQIMEALLWLMSKILYVHKCAIYECNSDNFLKDIEISGGRGQRTVLPMEGLPNVLHVDNK